MTVPSTTTQSTSEQSKPSTTGATSPEPSLGDPTQKEPLEAPAAESTKAVPVVPRHLPRDEQERLRRKLKERFH